MAEKIVGWMGERQSRRGFLAWCGKLSLALGLAMAGADRLVLTARAACCAGTPCGAGCPFVGPQYCGYTTAGCPLGCTYIGVSGPCCDTGTGTCHFCYNCNCFTGACVCECDTTISCSGGAC
jgi:hypothetical protein